MENWRSDVSRPLFLMLDIAEEEDKTRKRTRILRRRRINYGIRSGPLAKLQRHRNLQDIYQLLADWNESQFLASQPLLHPCRFSLPNRTYLGRLARISQLSYRSYMRIYGDITSALVMSGHPSHDTALTCERGSSHSLLVTTGILPWAVEIVANSASSFSSYLFRTQNILHFLHLHLNL
jgi:hypothetical protein